MAELRITVCDRCQERIVHGSRKHQVTLHDHHEHKIDLCGSCRDALSMWLKQRTHA